MSRSRTFSFKIENGEENDWTLIYNLEKNNICEYITAYKTKNDGDTYLMRGFIRFSNAKTITKIQKIFNNKVIVEIEKNNDINYKEQFLNFPEWFESGIPAKNNKNNKIKSRTKQLLEENDKKMNEIEENQNNLFLKHKEDKEQIKEQIEELIKLIKALKNNESEQLTQITNICLALTKNNPSVTNIIL